ncbi:MAG: AAA family ATPase [Bacteroidaceae bacterium]|nr:AAA family ATPase [Bacteroidaceae bacterium]
MTLKQLTIHNIASIEDARIDFENGVLQEDSIFLICGETGAGKTTILDAICLALYNNTPRLDLSNRRESYQDENGKKEQISTSDSSQLMRRNTTEAFVELRFKGSNEIDYTANWSIRRAHQKSNGALQHVAWTLTNDKKHKSYVKTVEIKLEIESAIGLSFEQYCRTALLAQGDFTRFLQSDEKQKSEILEKLTGTEIYSEIGKTIYLTDKENLDKFNLQKQTIDKFELMSSDEMDATKRHMNELSEAINKEEIRRQIILDKLHWIKQEKDLKGTLETKKQLWKEKADFLISDDFKRMEQYISDWDQTVEVRQCFVDLQTVNAECNDITRKEQEYRETFIYLQNGLNALTEQKNQCEQRLGEVCDSLKKLEADEEMFVNSQSILTKLRGILDAKKQINAYEEQKSILEHQSSELSEKVKEKKRTYDEVAKDNSARQNDIDRKNEALKLKGASELQKQKDDLQVMMERISTALKLLKDLATKEQDLELTKEHETRNQSRLSACMSLGKELQETVVLKTKTYERIKMQYEKMEKSISNYVKELRAELSVGDKCPVCGRVIETLDSDEDFQSALKPFKEIKEKAQGELQQSLQNWHENKAEAKSLNLLVSQSKDNTLKAQQVVNEEKQEVLQSCEACGLFNMDEDVMSKLNIQQKEKTLELNKVTEKLDKVQLLVREIANLQIEKNRLQNDMDNAQKKLNKVQDSMRQNQSDIRQNQVLINSQKMFIVKSVNEISDKISWKNWQTELQSDGDTFIKRLEKSAKDYDVLKNEEKDLKNRLDSIANEKRNVEISRNSILQLIPKWKELYSGEKQNLKDLNIKYIKLNTDIGMLIQKNKNVSEIQSKKTSQLDAFFMEHTKISRERLVELLNVNPSQIEEKRSAQQQKQKEEFEAKISYFELSAQNEKLQQEKPDMETDDTIEALTFEGKKLDGLIKTYNQNFGSEKQKVTQNEKLLETVKMEQDKLTFLRQKYNQWNRLCRLFGDAQGVRFRTIAQSYVLRNLLYNANGYLKYLSERYKLECQSGSLTILFRDLYQGGALRPVTTLSGGESFLVSLSLALGLSSLNRQGLSIDTLFIDEGFGTLSSDYLNVVMDTLEKLHQIGGKRVGIISHVESLRERIKTQIQINRNGQSSSKVEVIRVK